jgi:hypothetical protein
MYNGNRALFQATGYLGYGNYDITADGQHFLMIKQEDISNSPKELNVILNWSEELKRSLRERNRRNETHSDHYNNRVLSVVPD